MTRRIKVTEADDKTCPKYTQWRRGAGVFHYMVRYPLGRSAEGTDHRPTLAEARRLARRIVQDGAQWAEVYRWAENGVTLRKVLIATYEVDA